MHNIHLNVTNSSWFRPEGLVANGGYECRWQETLALNLSLLDKALTEALVWELNGSKAVTGCEGPLWNMSLMSPQGKEDR